MPLSKLHRITVSAMTSRVRDVAVKHGGTFESLARKMGVSAVALKSVEDMTASDEDVMKVAHSLQRIGDMIEASMKDTPEETDVAVKSVFGGTSESFLLPEIQRDASGKSLKKVHNPSRLPSGEANRDAAGRSIKKVYS